MKIALTGATGFIGRYIARHLVNQGHQLRCWFRPDSNPSVLFDLNGSIEWVAGQLGDEQAVRQLVMDCDATVHNAFWRPGAGFRGGEGNIVEFCRVNILGTLQLIEASRSAQVKRFVFVSTCAVHERILDDRPLDEAHPLWPLSHYGAHKAAIEKFVHSYGLGAGYDICAVRPTGVYGITHPLENSKWYGLVSEIVAGKPVNAAGGGKEVHAADVAKAIGILLQADQVAGQAFACYDQYISQYEVATIAKEISGSSSKITGQPKTPVHQIITEKIRRLGMEFGGRRLLRETVGQLVEAIGDQR